MARRCRRFFGGVIFEQPSHDFGFDGLVGFGCVIFIELAAREHQRHRTLLAPGRVLANRASATLRPDVQPGNRAENYDAEKKSDHQMRLRCAGDRLIKNRDCIVPRRRGPPLTNIRPNGPFFLRPIRPSHTQNEGCGPLLEDAFDRVNGLGRRVCAHGSRGGADRIARHVCTSTCSMNPLQ